MPKINSNTYGVGEEVEESGHYVCVPCGYQMHLKKGFSFPKCINCLDSKDKFVKDLELWEKI
jgi:hypothetical protein